MRRYCILDERYLANEFFRKVKNVMQLTILNFFQSNQSTILYSSSLAACFRRCLPFSAKPIRHGIKMGMKPDILTEPATCSYACPAMMSLVLPPL